MGVASVNSSSREREGRVESQGAMKVEGEAQEVNKGGSKNKMRQMTNVMDRKTTEKM